MLMMFVYGFFILFAGQNMISHALFQSAQSLSLDSYSLEVLGYEGEQPTMEEMANAWGNSLFASSPYYSTDKKWYSTQKFHMNTVIKDRFIGYLVGENPDDADDLLDYVGVENGLEGFDFTASEVEDGYLTLTVNYQQKFLFDFGDNVLIDMEQTVKVKMWGL